MRAGRMVWRAKKVKRHHAHPIESLGAFGRPNFKMEMESEQTHEQLPVGVVHKHEHSGPYGTVLYEPDSNCSRYEQSVGGRNERRLAGWA